MNENREKFARMVFDFLADDEPEDDDVVFEEFKIEWEKYGMLVAIYNLGFNAGRG